MPGRTRPAGSLMRIFTPKTWWTRSDRKSTRLNSSHSQISYAVFCLKKKKNDFHTIRVLQLLNEGHGRSLNRTKLLLCACACIQYQDHMKSSSHSVKERHILLHAI